MLGSLAKAGYNLGRQDRAGVPRSLGESHCRIFGGITETDMDLVRIRYP